MPVGNVVRTRPDLVRFGNYVPEGRESAPLGTLFLDIDAGKGYLKASGVLTNTGWGELLSTAPSASLTAGSVLFANSSGQVAQDNTNLFWNDTDNRLGIRTATPLDGLDVNTSATIRGQLTLADNLAFTAASARILPGATSLLVQNNANNATNIGILDNGDITLRGTLGGITTATATTFVGALTGNASTATLAAAATVLATPRAINGVNFDGSVAITVTAAAGTLTGATLAGNVLASSLTSLGTLTALTLNGNLTLSAAGAKIIAGATNLLIRSTGDGATNMAIADAGDIVFRATVSGITTLTATSLIGALTGNATTATTLETARTINGTSFNGSANITVTAAADTLTGTTLAANVVASSLTSVGTLTGLTVSGGTNLGSASSAATGTVRLSNGTIGHIIAADGGTYRDLRLDGVSVTLMTSGTTRVFLTTDRLYPVTDDQQYLGDSTHRWKQVWAVDGTIQTSTREAKENIARVNVTNALAAIIGAKFYQFNYKGSAFRQVGFLSDESDAWLTDGQHAYPQNTATLALAGVQALAARVAALEGP